MGDDFGDRLRREVAGWVRDGVITEGQADQITGRYPAGANGERGQGWVTSLLYGTAGVLLGAAVIAFILLGFDPDQPQRWMFGAGLLVAAGGVVMHVALPERSLLADAILAASLVPLTFAAFDEPFLPSTLAAYAVPVGLILWRRDAPFLPSLSVVAYSVAVPATWFAREDIIFGDTGPVFATWAASQFGLLLLVVGIDRMLRRQDRTLPAAVAAIALAISLAGFFGETMDLDGVTQVTLALGAVMGVLLVAGVVLRHQGLVTGSATALGVDAIVFAFEVGGLLLGTGALVALAGLLIWQAESLKGWVVEEEPLG